jgi:hypothetical protein
MFFSLWGGLAQFRASPWSAEFGSAMVGHERPLSDGALTM